MSATIFSYFDDWETEILHCPKCGWSGTFWEGDNEFYSQVMDCRCPACEPFHRPMLTIVEHPTVRECEANLDKMSEDERWLHNERMHFLIAHEATCLKSADRLPDLPGDSLILTWDFVVEYDSYTLTKNGDVVIWTEYAVFEGKERFKEIVDILKKKYGPRLQDVVPTPVSETYLYGDDLGAPRFVEQVRAALKHSE